MADNGKKQQTGERTPAAKVSRARNTGDLDALRRMHWLAVRTAYRAMKAAQTLDEQLSCIHALNQASGSYSKLLEKTDVAAELAEMRKELDELRKAPELRKVV